jgi:hypothetical protein
LITAVPVDLRSIDLNWNKKDAENVGRPKLSQISNKKKQISDWPGSHQIKEHTIVFD